MKSLCHRGSILSVSVESDVVARAKAVVLRIPPLLEDISPQVETKPLERVSNLPALHAKSAILTQKDGLPEVTTGYWVPKKEHRAQPERLKPFIKKAEQSKEVQSQVLWAYRARPDGTCQASTTAQSGKVYLRLISWRPPKQPDARKVQV